MCYSFRLSPQAALCHSPPAAECTRLNRAIYYPGIAKETARCTRLGEPCDLSRIVETGLPHASVTPSIALPLLRYCCTGLIADRDIKTLSFCKSMLFPGFHLNGRKAVNEKVGDVNASRYGTIQPCTGTHKLCIVPY